MDLRPYTVLELSGLMRRVKEELVARGVNDPSVRPVPWQQGAMAHLGYVMDEMMPSEIAIIRKFIGET